MKKRQLQVSYDEASSSDSDSSSSSSSDRESDAISDQELDELPNVGNSKVEHDNDGSDDDSTSTSDDEDDESKSHDEPDQPIQTSKKRRDEEGDDDDDDDEEEEPDDIELPLQERLRRQEKAGRAMQLKTQRERKRTALQIASERLSHIKQSTSSERTNKRKIGRDDENDDDDDDDDASDTSVDHQDTTESKRKKSKHAPTEASSKRSDFFRRGFRLNESGLGVEIGARRYKPLDPRMSSLRGHLNEEQFEKNYEFLQEMRNNEIANLKKQIAARKEVGKKGQRIRRKLGMSLIGGSLQQDEERLKQLKQEKADFERRKIERAAKQAVKKKIQTEVEEGKRGAYYLKRKEKKKLEFEAKLEELRKRGGHQAVEKALAKKRKKAKSRDASKFAK